MTLSTRRCSVCGLTVAAPQNLEQIIPDHWVQDPRAPYELMCGGCHSRSRQEGWLPPARHEMHWAQQRETLELIKKGLMG